MAIDVLVVDDSSVMRLLVSDVLKQDANLNIIGVARNGRDALEKTKELDPDVVVMDMIMGEYDGVYGVRKIMNLCPVPILLLSSIGNTNLTPIMEALSLGAFDYLNKPADGSTKIRDIGKDLIYKVKQASKTDIKKLLNGKVSKNINHHTFATNLPYEAIAIGASTGGPTAVEKVIAKLPGNLAIPVLIGQHMPENFVPSFVQRLNKITPLEVVMGKVGMEVEAGKIIIAPGSRNMIIKRNEIGKVVVSFTQKRWAEYNFPSINGLIESVAEVYGKKTIGVILTGMGKDGAKGLIKVKNNGGYTIVQDEKTSVVFGMPGEAIKSVKVDSIVPINEIGNFLVSCLS